MRKGEKPPDKYNATKKNPKEVNAIKPSDITPNIFTARKSSIDNVDVIQIMTENNINKRQDIPNKLPKSD